MALNVDSIWSFVWDLMIVRRALLIGAAGALCIGSQQTVVAADRPQLSGSQTDRFEFHSYSSSRLQGGSEWQPQHHLEHSRRLSQTDESHRSELPDLAEGPQALFSTADACEKPQFDTSSSSSYFIDGQTLRKNITDDQGGIDLTLHLQFVERSNCDLINGLFVDVWHSNATGVYSGVQMSENAGGADLTTENFHRGVAQTDEHGIVTFETKFPGHTQGRTSLLHVLASHQGSLATNSTYSTDYIPLQALSIFFDEALLQEVNAVEPYVSVGNHTTNIDDYLYSILILKSFDPHLKYAYKGENITDGVVGWLRIGIDLAVSSEVVAEGTLGIPNNGGPRPKPEPVLQTAAEINPAEPVEPTSSALLAVQPPSWLGVSYGVAIAALAAPLLLPLAL